MTTDIATPIITHSVSGTGPYAIPWPYTAAEIYVLSNVDGDYAELGADAEFTLSAPSGLSGSLFLTPEVVARLAGGKITIERRTIIEQGWQSQTSREAALMANMDRLARGLQDVSAQARRALRVTTSPLLPVEPRNGHTIIWKNGQPIEGPSATHIAAAAAGATQILPLVERAEIAATQAELYDGPKVDTFPELAGVTPDMLPIGGFIRVVELGAVYQRVGSGGHLDYSGTGGVRLNVLPGADGFDARAFGAIGDGVADDTAFVQAALTAGDLAASYPIRMTGTVILPFGQRSVTFTGAARFIFSPASSGTAMFDARRFPGIAGFIYNAVTFNNVRAYSETVRSVFVRAEEQRDGAGPHVVGSIDFVTLSGCSFYGQGAGTWQHIAHMKNAGGLIVDRTTASNFPNTSAQTDAATAAYYFDHDDDRFFIIRALYWDQSYTSRFYDAFRVYSENSVESFYIGQGEIVGHHHGIFKNGPGSLQAIHLDGPHMDCIKANVWADAGAINVFRTTGADLRLGQNGAAAAADGVNIKMVSGNYASIMGGFMDAFVNTQKGILIDANVPGLIVSGVVFRRHAVSVDAPSVTVADVSGNTFESVLQEYNLSTGDGIKADQSARLSLQLAGYTGDLDALAGARKEMFSRRLGAGFTNGPTGVSGAGQVCVTMAWDANSAYQELFAAAGRPMSYVRRKVAGTWGPWMQVVGLNAQFAIVTVTGNGSPEGVITGPRGSFYLRADGGAGTTFYVKESGTGNTGWVGK